MNLEKQITMDIQTSKIQLVKMILNIENDKFIQKIADFIKTEKEDFWNELSISEQKEILQGIEDLDKGKKIAYSDFLKKIS